MSAGMLLILGGEQFLLADSRYYEMAKAAAKNTTVLLAANFNKDCQAILEKTGVKTLALEAGQVTLRQYEKMKASFKDVLLCTDGSLDAEIERLRKIKTAVEITKLKHSQQVTDEAFTAVLPLLKEGTSEIEIALALEICIRRQGCGIAFETIVASGENSSRPHGHPGQRRFRKGDLVTMDFGAVYEGYHSDMTRTVGIGALPEQQISVYETVLAAQEKAFEVIFPGAVCKQVDAAARSYIDSSPYKGCFGHGLGHGVGLEIHELPNVNVSDETVLEPGMALSVEPGIYLEGQFGVRIEDVVLITSEGYENLAKTPKELLIL